MIQLSLLTLAMVLASAAAPRTICPGHPEGTDDRACASSWRWAEPDLHHRLTPDRGNVGVGTVLRINDRPTHKIWREQMRPDWEHTDVLIAYTNNNDLIDWYGELERLHLERTFYETTEHLSQMRRYGAGLILSPGTVLVSTADPVEKRFTFTRPTVEFMVARAEVLDGEVTYRPTTTRGVLPFEVLNRSATVIFPTLVLTRTAGRAGGCDQALRLDRW